MKTKLSCARRIFKISIHKSTLLLVCLLCTCAITPLSQAISATELGNLSCDRTAKIVRGAMNSNAQTGVTTIEAILKEAGIKKSLANMSAEEASAVYHKWKQCSAAGQSGGVNPPWEEAVTEPFLEKVAEAKKIEAHRKQQQAISAEKAKQKAKQDALDKEKKLAEEEDAKKLAEEKKRAEEDNERLFAEKKKYLSETKRYFSVDDARAYLRTLPFYREGNPDWRKYKDTQKALLEKIPQHTRDIRELVAACTLVINGDLEFQKFDAERPYSREDMLVVYDYCPRHLDTLEQILVKSDKDNAERKRVELEQERAKQEQLAAQKVALDAQLNHVISMVQSMHTRNYPANEGYKAIGKAFSSFFSKPIWTGESFTGMPGWVVTFSGIAQVDGRNAKVKVTFRVPKNALNDAGLIQIRALINDSPYNINDLLAGVYLN